MAVTESLDLVKIFPEEHSELQKNVQTKTTQKSTFWSQLSQYFITRQQEWVCCLTSPF